MPRCGKRDDEGTHRTATCCHYGYGHRRLFAPDGGRRGANPRCNKATAASIFSPNIDARGGRIVKLLEEGALVAFNSAVDAVECAISLQEELARDQEELPSGERIVLRIGINLADVVIEGDDLLGDGVYVAARLEASAEPGGICIADAVHRQLGGKCRTAFLDGGEISLKNIARPVHVWHSGIRQ
ncbi:adenylate/guanylate cyclase domain-containing protein [Sinorhizobium meliloti]|uniref:adenylate/guanylate cyclase domain-containing protein n=1 Tax=Rhizobium meliloti TaxID=382 RepID=UPI002D799EBB|nr:adenylate/guanylate cyclase domain-containing protein [Sinorhizobium meliloti]